jgi:hypothetical protein
MIDYNIPNGLDDLYGPGAEMSEAWPGEAEAALVDYNNAKLNWETQLLECWKPIVQRLADALEYALNG